MARLRKRVKQLEMEREILTSGGLVRSGKHGAAEEIFELVKAYQAEYPERTMCRVLNISASGFYAWSVRSPSEHYQRDTLLGDRIEAIHRRSRLTYGRPRIHAALAEEGIRVSSKRVARLMRSLGIHGASRRKTVVTTIRDRDAKPAPDLVDRRSTAKAPNQLWVADITYVPTWSGFLYLAVVLDVFSRRVVGWAMADHMRKELVLDALDMAIYRRKPLAVVHHSDQGSQYTSIAFALRCKAAGIRPSMGSRGDCYDNAMCESFNATLQCELLVKNRIRTQREPKRRCST